jgi:DtxR family transcriptional regulator, Mn-dependent transcriptional regulator
VKPNAPSTTESVDDYLKAILELGGPSGERATSNALARRLGVAAASVTGMLQKLASRKPVWIDYQKHRGACLTREGRHRAMQVVRRHRLLELFLCEVLGYSWDEVHAEAERLEHFISEKLADRIAEKLGDPKMDPHGQLIPRKDGSLTYRVTVRLDELAPGEKAVISSVSDHEPEMLRYLEHQGLIPGRNLVVVEHAPFDGPIIARLGAGKGTRALSLKLAQAVLVQRASL